MNKINMINLLRTLTHKEREVIFCRVQRQQKEKELKQLAYLRKYITISEHTLHLADSLFSHRFCDDIQIS